MDDGSCPSAVVRARCSEQVHSSDSTAGPRLAGSQPLIAPAMRWVGQPAKQPREAGARPHHLRGLSVNRKGFGGAQHQMVCSEMTKTFCVRRCVPEIVEGACCGLLVAGPPLGESEVVVRRIAVLGLVHHAELRLPVLRSTRLPSCWRCSRPRTSCLVSIKFAS